MPTGPVTPGKAWIEMVHRYLAMGVGVLITVLAVAAWLGRTTQQGRAAISPWWPTATLMWVCIQGAFGALTVTMKLFPAIVTLHLLGGYILLALLTVQVIGLGVQQKGPPISLVRSKTRLWVALGLGVLLAQSASGAWVSTNYAVLACAEFPMCQGSWWPPMDFGGGFEIWRPLGFGQDGAHISFQALTAVHYTHRMFAAVTLVLLAALAWSLRSSDTLRRPAQALALLLALQFATGLSNVVLDWPIVAAILHTGGAGAMVVVLVWLLSATRTLPSPQTETRTPMGLLT
jgi:cytochrome c oxidase assembly protein subunit 15